MTQDQFVKITEMSPQGQRMLSDLIGTIPLTGKDAEYLKHMIAHIVRNERCDAAVNYHDHIVKNRD